MIVTLAVQNLIHDRARFAMTVLGIAASVVLVIVQLGLLMGFDRTISAMLDHAGAELWIIPSGTSAFDEPAVLDESERYAALSAPGVASVSPLLIGFAEWRPPAGGTATVILIGSEPRTGVLRPWNITQGSANDLSAPESVAVDSFYSKELGVSRLGDVAKIEGRNAQVMAVTSNIRSFTTSPYVFASLEQARIYLDIPQGKATYLAVRLEPAQDPETIRIDLAKRLRNVDVLTTSQFRRLNLIRWLFESGAGVVLLLGAAMGLVVGALIVTQTLYASVKDHLQEFATLRALGSSKGFLRSVVLCQAALSALAGTALAFLVGFAIVGASANSFLPVVVTPLLFAVILFLSSTMCLAAAIAAISKVTKVDPAMVFAR